MPEQELLTPKPTENELWRMIEEVAHTAGLDVHKFGAPHRQIVRDMMSFLAEPERLPPSPPPHTPRRWRHVVRKLAGQAVPPQASEAACPVPPIIMAGEPGTGKTTFLAVLDVVVRRAYGLPDNLAAEMRNDHGRVLRLPKRTLNRHTLSLLSVRKWSELLHFYTWDTAQHRLVPENMTRFIQQTLYPMRILFADEVEMFGYAPTIPDLARHGLLVVGTPNQYAFQQLEQERIYRFGGVDMRAGNPHEAVVTSEQAAWSLFEQVAEQPAHTFERLIYQRLDVANTRYVRLDFNQAVQAPWLEPEWMRFLTAVRVPDQPLTILFEEFTLDVLRPDYNAIIRFVTLFDVIEQLELCFCVYIISF